MMIGMNMTPKNAMDITERRIEVDIVFSIAPAISGVIALIIVWIALAIIVERRTKMYFKMMMYFVDGYGIDRTYGCLREDGWAVDYDYVAVSYQEFHKRAN